MKSIQEIREAHCDLLGSLDLSPFYSQQLSKLGEAIDELAHLREEVLQLKRVVESVGSAEHRVKKELGRIADSSSIPKPPWCGEVSEDRKSICTNPRGACAFHLEAGAK